MGLFSVTPIKPQSFKQVDVEARIVARLRRYAPLIVADLERCTATWEHKPHWNVTVTQGGGYVTLSLSTDSTIFLFVEEGTRPHVINAKPGGRLAIYEYKAKTRPGSLNSGAGGKGGFIRLSQAVNHPGFPGRQFLPQIAKRHEQQLGREVMDELSKIVQETGHGL